MSTSVLEPGTRLAGRYRLEARVSESSGSTLWKAVDETLARLVAVRTFAEDFTHAREVVTAARAASRVTDSRLAQVFDADDPNGHPYVVSEWVVGEALSDLIGAGPLEPESAAGIIAEAAEALAGAHAIDLAHLRLRPHCLIWTPNGTVKITGLGIDAALDGIQADDPGAVDAQGLGRLLYAALTGHWPGDGASAADVGLPSAPDFDGRPSSPHQVRAAIPHMLDAVTERALLQEARRGRPPIATPADLAQELADVPRPAPALLPTPPPPPFRGGPPTSTAPPPTAAGADQPFTYRGPGTGPTLLTKGLVTVVALLVAVALGVAGWQVGRTIMGRSNSAPPPDGQADAQGQVLDPQEVSGYDPLGDGDEKTDQASFAVDSDAGTGWETEGYNSADFGRLKPGVGLLVDMGSPVRVQSVTVDLGGTPGASFAVRVSDTAEGEDFQTLGKVTDAGEKARVEVSEPIEGRYVTLWLTELPPNGGRYRAHVAEVVIRGER